MFKKLLIANRGEIVRRIIRTCRDLDIKTVVIYSDADKNMFYLQEADEAYNIGLANPLKSYLNIEAIIEVLKKSGADAVHPGYGFLSENSSFAKAVAATGAAWIGPPPVMLKAIDSKCYCREIASRIGIPIVPGTVSITKGVDDIYRFSSKHGYPIVLKLDKGGGGKGIELVEENGKVIESFERLSRIGLMAFGNSESYIEKEIVNPRHIEVQFIADGAKKCVCLGERECSIQRRYQKIIEESPSPVVANQDRMALFDYTSRLALTMGYKGAGTMEFLRSEEGKYYFMEINARLQVEHPVTEFLTGMDIVRKQLEIASEEGLAIGQEDIILNGHAIEARIYAEDPLSFAPSPGIIKKLIFPGMDDGFLRIDHAIEEGGIVPPYYDPLLAKIIAWGANRPAAIERLNKALSDFQIEGIKTTIPTNLLVIGSKKYTNGDFHTGFIKELYFEENLVAEQAKILA